MTIDLRDDDKPFQLPKATPLGEVKKPGILDFSAYVQPAPPPKEEQEAEIRRLATLGDVDYENERSRICAQWGWRKSTLDKLVDRERVSLRAAEDALGLDRKPALETVEGTELVNGLVQDLTKYVSLQPDFAVIAAFWVIHTYLLDYIPMTPRLHITAPEKGCGKSTLVDWLETVVQRPLKSDNITAAAVYHMVQEKRPTLMLDEGHAYIHIKEELRGVLNSGHKGTA
jgi:putative DNA primase/helicase